MSFSRHYIPILFIVALLLIFVAERIISADSSLRWIVVGVGAFGVASVVGFRALEWLRAGGAAKRAAGRAALGYLAAALALAIYPFTTAGGMDALGLAEEERGAWASAWTVGYLIVLLSGALVALFTDWSRAGLTHPERVELPRVRAAGAGALSLAFAVCWVFVLNYVANAHDDRWEWSENTLPKPGDGTLELVGGLTEDVEATLFYPPANEVLERVIPYFTALDEAGARLSVAFLDHAIEPARAKDLGVRKNGVLVFRRGKKRERVNLNVELKKARHKLKELDRRVQEALLKVARDPQTVYLTVGHGERASVRPDDPRPKVRLLKEMLRKMNIKAKDLGVKHGLGAAVPEDAGVVIVLGPDSRFLPEEVESLREWHKGGGSLFLLLDPGVEHGLEGLLVDLGVEIPAGVVAHERYHMVKTRGPADRSLLVTNRYGSHEAVSVLSRYANQAALILDEAGAVHTMAGADAKTQVLIRPMLKSWLDLDGDRERDEGEPEEKDAIAVASTTGAGDDQARAVVVADSDLFDDRWMVYAANQQFFFDAYMWLAGEDNTSLRITAVEKDPPLRHTRDQDAFLFWSTTAGVPLLVLGAGLVFVRRRRRKIGATQARKGAS